MAIALMAASIGLPASAIATKQSTAATQKNPDPAAAANLILDDLDAGRFDAVYARFTPAMAQAVSADKLKAVWASMPQQFGKFEHRGTARVDAGDGFTVVDVPLVYERVALAASITISASGKVAGFFVHPAPPPPAKTRSDLSSREVQFGPAQRSALPGTLLLPKGMGPFPAVVLVHGSGPNDRNETVGGTRVFLDIAEGLADRGIASLRYEKRTKAHPDEFTGAYTIDDETTDDAVAAVAFLKTQPNIDPKRIYVVGHSQGAMMAPRIAQHAPGLAGIVLMAAPARHLEDILIDQSHWLAMADGKIDASERKQIDALKVAVAAVKKIDAHTPPTRKSLLDLPASYWRGLQGYDPVAVAKSETLPLLILQGDRDFQVTAPDWSRWNAAFARDPRATIRHYPVLNHLFVAGKGAPSMAEYATPGHVDALVTANIADWIKGNR